MKIVSIIQIILLSSTLTSCSTFKQADKDFKDFYNTIVYYNFPDKKDGWSENCDFCMPNQKCKWQKCPNK